MSTIKIYTDGSYQQSVNPNVSGWSFVVAEHNLHGSGVVQNPVSRNIDGELMAVQEALLWIEKDSQDKVKEYEIIYDYQGVGAWAKNEWNANTPLTQGYKKFVGDMLISLLNKGVRVNFKWVKGHSGNEYNEIADDLAKVAVIDFTENNVIKKIPRALLKYDEAKEILNRIEKIQEELNLVSNFLVENFK